MADMPYQLNAARTFGEPFSVGLKIYKLSIDLSLRSFQERNQIARNLARKLERSYHGISAIGHEQTRTIIYMLSRLEPKTEDVEFKSKGILLKLQVSYDGTIQLGPEKPQVLNELLREAIRIRAREKGFQQGFSAGKFYGGSPKLFMVGDFQEPVYVHEGFKTKTRVFSDGSALVYLKPTATCRITLLDFVKTLLARGVSRDDLKAYVIDGRPKRAVVTGPFGKSGLVVDIAFDLRPEIDKIGNETLANYWLRTHGIRLVPDDLVVYVDVDGTTLSYPASQTYLSTQGLEFSRDQRALFTLSPSRERLRVLQLLRQLLSEPLSLGDVTVTFKVADLVEIDQLKREGKILEYGVLEQPSLSFGNSGTGMRPIDIRFHGPYSGKRDLNIVYVAPSIASDIIEPFHSILAQEYNQRGFGTLASTGVVEIRAAPTRIAYRKAAVEALSKLRDTQDPKVAMVLLPVRGEAKYEFIKGASSHHDHGERHYQFILVGTVRKVIDGRREILDSVLNQLYFKSSPTDDRALWVLTKPAGGVGHTIYAAYDISREVRKQYDPSTKRVISEKTEAASRAALCDCFGLSVRIRSEISPIGEIMTGEIIHDLILDLEDDARASLKKFDNDFKRFVLFKDGEVYFNERALATKSLKEINTAIPNLAFEMYSVVKRGIERIFQSDTNAPPGFYVIIDQDQGLLVSSDLSLQRDRAGNERLLASPLVIKRELVVSNDVRPSVKQILAEFFDLSRLHWQSPRIKMKTSLPLQIVQEMGYYARRGITMPADMEYVPL